MSALGHKRTSGQQTHRGIEKPRWYIRLACREVCRPSKKVVVFHAIISNAKKDKKAKIRGEVR